MRPPKSFDCVEMKRKIQEKIYEETKDLSRDELIDYFRRDARTGPFADLWEAAGKNVRSATKPRTQ